MHEGISPIYTRWHPKEFLKFASQISSRKICTIGLLT